MDQSIIMALLQESAAENCSKDRRDAIREELAQAARDVDYPITGSSEELLASLGVSRLQILPLVQDTYSGIVFDTYQQTEWHDPSHLPRLFPVFAALCGDRAQITTGEGDLPTQPMFDVVDWEAFAEAFLMPKR